MARQVYFDPFGSYTRGFDTGMQRQMGLEDSVRRARAQDYDYNVLQPYRTAAVQRQDQLDTRAQPYKINMLPIGYQNALDNMYMNQYGLAQRGAQTFGIPQPLTDWGSKVFGLQFATTSDPATGMNTTIFARGPDGQLYPVARQHNYGQQVLDQGANFDRNLKLEQLRNQQIYYGGMANYREQEAMARQIAAQAAMLRAQGVNGGTYAPNGTGLAGFDNGYPGYDPTLDYQLPQ